MADLGRIEALILPIVEASELALVRVALLEMPEGLTLQVMAEDPGTRQLGIDACARLSRQISAMLDEEDPIDAEYSLEVSSPGIDRPLTRAADFRDWTGHVAKLLMATPRDGRKRFQGRLLGTEQDSVQMAIDGVGEVTLPLDDIASAKLVLTDELIAATAPQMEMKRN